MQTDKRFQRSDWRKRPLSPEQLQYARMDTHFLLFIADELRKRLLQFNQSSAPTESIPIAGPQVSELRHELLHVLAESLCRASVHGLDHCLRY